MNKLSLSDLELSGKRVFMRVDFNVPMSDGVIADDSRIRAALPSIRHVVAAGGRLVLGSHLGRPRGGRTDSLSLRPLSERLGQLIGTRVDFAQESIGPEIRSRVDQMEAGDVLLLENLRFYIGEEANDESFASELAGLCDVFVNDAFGTAHRAHASTAGIAAHVTQSAAGFLMQRELESLDHALRGADRPYVSIVGGAKISGKIELVENFLTIADDVLIGGAMAYTFFRAQGLSTGTSLVEEDRLTLARELLETAREQGTEIQLPRDHVVSSDFKGTDIRTVGVAETGSGEMGLDIGPATVRAYEGVIKKARTIVWNGPMGVFENEKFSGGTIAIARAVAGSDAFSIVGGGDSASAVIQAGVAGEITHISTGGGASLEFLSGRKLPGVEALTDKTA
jgi:phosphoglycerate kinase